MYGNSKSLSPPVPSKEKNNTAIVLVYFPPGSLAVDFATDRPAKSGGKILYGVLPS